jgi:hypothetical protein
MAYLWKGQSLCDNCYPAHKQQGVGVLSYYHRPNEESQTKSEWRRLDHVILKLLAVRCMRTIKHNIEFREVQRLWGTIVHAPTRIVRSHDLLRGSSWRADAGARYRLVQADHLT